MNETPDLEILFNYLIQQGQRRSFKRIVKKLFSNMVGWQYACLEEKFKDYLREKHDEYLLEVIKRKTGDFWGLIPNPGKTIPGTEVIKIDVAVCLSCKKGFLTKKIGKWGEFYGCSRYIAKGKGCQFAIGIKND